MRIGDHDSPYVNSASFRFNSQRASEKTDDSAGASTEACAVSISREAREAYQTYTLGRKADTGEKREVREDFLEYMKSSREAPRDKEERIKELKGTLKKLQAELNQVAGDERMPEETKNARMETLNMQIQGVLKEIAGLSEDLAGEAAAG